LFNLTTALLTFAVIFPAELPDKSMLASLVLGTRYRTLPVWLGVSAAFLVHVVIAVAAGGLLSLLPDTVVGVVVTVLFALGAVILLRGGGDDPEADVETAATTMSSARMFWTSFGVVFVGEWGDITQLATANLAARYQDPLSVGLGAGLALISVAGLVLVAGNRLLSRVPIDLVRRGAGILLAILAVISLIQLLR
jgi:putative Ca2+/H+ antiporter (TMEM165/GDT1 family)